MNYYYILLIIFVCFLVVMSLITFVAYGRDKKKAIKGMDRTKEKTLLFLSSFGGGIGAFFGRIFFHHKTDKSYFSIVIYLSLICEIALIIVMVVGGIHYAR